jgi:hypothetical protein
MTRRTLAIAALACGASAASVLGTARPALASDHGDSPSVVNDPAADINDVYAWMQGDNVVLAMTVIPNAQPTAADGAAGSQFSDAVQYVFHTTSQASFGAATVVPEDIIATFDANQNISVWVGADDYVKGATGTNAALVSLDGRLKVFAGLIGDPFFFNIDGFHNAVGTVESLASSLTLDPSGCPLLTDDQAALLRTQLTTSPDGGTAVDHFASFDALAIVISLDKSLLTRGGPIVAEWASTNQAQ